MTGLSRNVVRVVLAALAVGAAVFAGVNAASPDAQHFTLHFAEVKGLYVGDSVDVLGVNVGRVTEIDAGPDSVRVGVEVSGDRPIPADAKAVLVAPSLVSVRHVALAPVYGGGPKMADGATIPLSRTAVPVEWDEIKEQLVRLSDALGPGGANKDGSLSRFLDASSGSLEGQGAEIGQTLERLSEALRTLADSKGDIFATVRNLNTFVAALEASDTQVRAFNDQLAGAADLLADNRTELAAALKSIEGVFKDLTRFTEAHRADLTSTVTGLRSTTKLLADNRQNLADILQVAPTTMSNFYNTYDPVVPAMTGSLVTQNMDSPAMFLCSAVYSLGQSPETCADLLAPVAKYLRVEQPPVGLSVLENNRPGGQVPGPQAPDEQRGTP